MSGHGSRRGVYGEKRKGGRGARAGAKPGRQTENEPGVGAGEDGVGWRGAHGTGQANGASKGRATTNRRAGNTRHADGATQDGRATKGRRVGQQKTGG